MNSTTTHSTATVACPFCGTLNRVNLERVADRPKCGQCGKPIWLDRPVAVTEASFDAMVNDTTVPVLVDFYADWCGPCKIMAPLLDEIASAYQGRVLVAKVDTDRAQRATQPFGI